MPRQNGAEIARQQRRLRVLQSKVAGASVRQIAEQEGVSAGQIQKDVNRALGDLAKEHIGHADQVRSVQMERLNQLLLRWYPLALQQDAEATHISLKIMDKISQINGVIPDKPLIAIQQNAFSDSTPVTFIIENANNDDTDGNQIPTPESLPEATQGDLHS